MFCRGVKERSSDFARAGQGSELQVALHQFAESFAIFVFHVHEFHPVARITDIADHSGKMDFTQSGADLELNGISNGQFLVRFEVGATKADGPDAREPSL